MSTVAITGHTSGLGRALLEYFQQQGHRVLGFSRSNGYDICDAAARDRIIDQARTADIFVNNAYHDFDRSQLLVLEQIFEAWQGQHKTIINVSSRYTQDPYAYCRTKLEQDQFCDARIYQQPRIINLKPGLIDTPRSRHISGSRLQVQQVLSVVEFALNNHARSITFGL